VTKVRLDPPRLILMNYIDGYALRRLAVAVLTAVQVGSILRRTALR
jgi:hypothetical protein